MAKAFSRRCTGEPAARLRVAISPLKTGTWNGFPERVFLWDRITAIGNAFSKSRFSSHRGRERDRCAPSVPSALSRRRPWPVLRVAAVGEINRLDLIDRQRLDHTARPQS